jgi:aminoglycoside 6'-N-acetyltransferase
MSDGTDPDFTIRDAVPADEPALTEIQRQSAAHHHAVNPTHWRTQTLEEADRSRRRWHVWQPADGVLVADAGGEVVGMIELWLKRPRDPDSARPPMVRVDYGIAVADSWRGRGVGTALLLAAEDWAKARGARQMAMNLDSHNVGALKLYARLGYEVSGLEMDKSIEPDPGTEDDPTVERNLDGEPVPTLNGELCVLRPLRWSDRDALIDVLRDPSVVAIWDTRGAEHSANELLAGDSHWTVWAIEVDGEFAGSIQAAENDDEDYRSAGIDIFMTSRFQGRGIGTDAVRMLARYLIDVRGHHRLTIDPAASNTRAIRTYEKVGFKPVGVMRRYERGVDGTYHDGLLMDLLAGELT